MMMIMLMMTMLMMTIVKIQIYFHNKQINVADLIIINIMIMTISQPVSGNLDDDDDYYILIFSQIDKRFQTILMIMMMNKM